MLAKHRRFIGDIGQWFAGTIGTIGIVIEIVYKAHIGHICITMSALTFAVATKIKYYKGK